VQCSSGLRSTFRLVPKRSARSRLSYSLGEPPKPEVFRAAEVYALGSTCGCHDLWIIAIFSIPLRIPDLRHLVPDSKRRHPNAHSAEYSTPVWILRRNKRSLVGLAYSIELFCCAEYELGRLRRQRLQVASFQRRSTDQNRSCPQRTRDDSDDSRLRESPIHCTETGVR